MTWGEDRNEAIARMKRALEETIIIGPPTTIPFHERILDDARFVKGDINTGLVTEWLAEQPVDSSASSAGSARGKGSLNGKVDA